MLLSAKSMTARTSMSSSSAGTCSAMLSLAVILGHAPGVQLSILRFFAGLAAVLAPAPGSRLGVRSAG